jgi:hypothetical protein
MRAAQRRDPWFIIEYEQAFTICLQCLQDVVIHNPFKLLFSAILIVRDGTIIPGE